MSNVITLHGKCIVSGTAEGEALVIPFPVSFLGMVNTENGTFEIPGSEYDGSTIKDKILIYPFGKGSSGDAIRMWRLQKFDQSPLAILFDRAEPVHVQGAMLLNIPSAFGFDKSLIDEIDSGDHVCINDGEIIITKTASAATSTSTRP